MRIRIIGSGNMGRALGARPAALGHNIFFGARRREAARAAGAVGGVGRAGTNEEAAAHGELLVWTVRDCGVGMRANLQLRLLSEPDLPGPSGRLPSRYG